MGKKNEISKKPLIWITSFPINANDYLLNESGKSGHVTISHLFIT